MSSKSLNRVLLIGNVTRDPELRYTPQGNAVATFGLATNRSWKTENGEIREEAEFHRLVSWNKLAELCAQLCTKGRKIYVEGRLQTRTFTGSDNAQHTITEIVIDDMILLDSKFAGAGAQTAANTPTANTEPATEAQQKDEPKEGKKEERKEKKAKEEKEEAKEAPKPSDAAQGKEDVNIDDIPF
ncbi:single-stranded DNA-binding protein [Patescibacteria group bacterium]|nr:single-stranded DNA-binding protein [Patescibacteria group bacterium]